MDGGSAVFAEQKLRNGAVLRGRQDGRRWEGSDDRGVPLAAAQNVLFCGGASPFRQLRWRNPQQLRSHSVRGGAPNKCCVAMPRPEPVCAWRLFRPPSPRQLIREQALNISVYSSLLTEKMYLCRLLKQDVICEKNST